MSGQVDYDKIAANYDSRYERNEYAGVKHAVAAFVRGGPPTNRRRVLEVGCGTGRWVDTLRETAGDIFGLDLSRGMLDVARTRLPGRLIRARAEAIPCLAQSVDRIFCVNALHHFTDPAAFFRDARRVLDHDGGLLTVGLDPHSGRDRWWIYDYFPTALVEDRRRYLPSATIRKLMEASGFSQCETREVQHIPAQMTLSEAARRGFLDRTSTSQLMVISQREYEAGVMRIKSANGDRVGETLLAADLHIYGTTGWAA
jgi:SAM-dependent methyltransferase